MKNFWFETPKPVFESVNKATAEEAKAKLTVAGATVELQ
ncbi:MAG: ribosomal protein L7/L12 [Candidatus Daviesbacteria bacterium]|nr:ribosomal protein L7/L12 [Candidatus Daviesbacteria bacterium]